MPLDHRAVEQAIRSVEGVAEATVRPTTEGRARLSISLRPGADPHAVSRAVARVLRQRFGLNVDPAAILARSTVAAAAPAPEAVPPSEEAPAEAGPAPTGEVPAAEAVAAAPAATGERPAEEAPAEAGPAPTGEVSAAEAAAPTEAAPAAPPAVEAPAAVPPGETLMVAANGQPPRPRIVDLAVEEEGLRVRARVRLEVGDHTLEGQATGARTRLAILRAVARATLDALGVLLGDRAQLELEAVTVTDDGTDEQVVVTVSCVTRDSIYKLVGGAVVRGDDQIAALRATLDATNRRVPYLVAASS